MATSTPVRHAWRALIGLLAVIAVLFGINSLGTYVFKDANGAPASSWAPQLALDLQGGTQIILKAASDEAAPSAEQMQQAVSIIRQRVDASGVGETEITTEGNSNVVVAIPGPMDQDTRNRIEASAQMELRAVLLAGAGTPSAEAPADDADLETEPATTPTDGSDPAWITPKVQADFAAYDCAAPASDLDKAPKDQPLITCDDTGVEKYVLGPVELTGDQIVDASNGYNQQEGRWVVQVHFNGEGTKAFGEVSKRLFALKSDAAATAQGRDRFAFVLDGSVITAPGMNGAILDGRPEISGQFDQDSSKTLADQLKFGALPISFEVQSDATISATLGSQQLQIGLLAALIGLALVALFSLISYRSLGFVIIASLAVMAVITYAIICILGWRMGFRLSLAGVAGLIVTIGFTADSFIVYFERIRDELRDGKSVVSAVEDGWGRAKRTIYISKSINILCALVLYILADATVKGFAFTLGLTTLIDILIFVIFTHPIMQLLSRTRFFGNGHPLSGMNAPSLAASFAQRTAFRDTTDDIGSRGRAARTQRSRGEAERRQTIAERKQAEALALSARTKSGEDA